ncbi:hypothetical protein BC826DRAFT_231772 [Russula brevipes]|nr:hypothetical protein BC826DRAFT_231772 [Russula brevipes]
MSSEWMDLQVELQFACQVTLETSTAELMALARGRSESSTVLHIRGPSLWTPSQVLVLSTLKSALQQHLHQEGKARTGSATAWRPRFQASRLVSQAEPRCQLVQNRTSRVEIAKGKRTPTEAVFPKVFPRKCQSRTTKFSVVCGDPVEQLRVRVHRGWWSSAGTAEPLNGS